MTRMVWCISALLAVAILVICAIIPSAPAPAPLAISPPTLSFLRAIHERGWYNHLIEVANDDRQWDSEVSSVDTSFVLGGALTAARYFSKDPDIPRLAQEIYDRVDFPWMLEGDPLILSHGWKRGKGFLKYKWETYSESSLLYLLAI